MVCWGVCGVCEEHPKMVKKAMTNIVDLGCTMVLIIMAKQRILVCPICGETQPETNVCVVCNTLLEQEGILLAEGGIGPWWIRNEDLPFRPGITYEQVVDLAKMEKIQLHTLMRGPTTRQLWKIARRVRGVAHLLGRCHNCGEHVDSNARQCESCNAEFLAFRDRNNLGVDVTTPTKGSIDGLSSFLSDEAILQTQSTPIQLPKTPKPAHSPEEESIGSPEFHSLKRKAHQSARKVKVLSVCLAISVIALIFVIVLLLSK